MRLKPNRCPKCNFGVISCTLHGDMFREYCTDCDYTRLRPDIRIGEDRRLKTRPNSKDRRKNNGETTS